MVEPWVSRWSRLVHGRLHHEPFLPDADSLEHSGRGLSGANGAFRADCFCEGPRDTELEVSTAQDRRNCPDDADPDTWYLVGSR